MLTLHKLTQNINNKIKKKNSNLVMGVGKGGCDPSLGFSNVVNKGLKVLFFSLFLLFNIFFVASLLEEANSVIFC